MRILYAVLGVALAAILFQNFSLAPATLSSSADTQSSPAEVKAYFNRPAGYQMKPKDPKYNLKARLIKYIDDAPNGSMIYASMFAAEDLDLLNALKSANSSKRQIKLFLVFDDQQASEDISKQFFLSEMSKHVKASGLGQVFVCNHGGCIGWKGNNHNKFFALSASKNDLGIQIENVSLQLSMNFMEEQQYQYQDMIAVENDDQIYNHYVNYWKALSDSNRLEPDYNFMNGIYGQTKSKQLNLKVFSSASIEEDPILLDLNKVHVDESLGGCRIDVTQSLLKYDLLPKMEYADEQSEDRAYKLLKKLSDLKKLGCEVHIVLTDEKKGDPDFAAAISDIEDSETQFDLILLKDEPTSNKSHSKLVLISAQFIDTDSGNLETRKIVYAGSMNMVTGSLRQNDDTMIRVRSQKIYNAYLEQVEHLRLNGTKSKTSPLYADYPNSNKGNFIFKSGVAIEPQRIRLSSSGHAKNCSISPSSLPAGLVFDRTSCEISGTPTTPSARKTYSISANSIYPNYASALALISIEVTGSVAPRIAYASSSYAWNYNSYVEIRPISQGTTGLTYSISPEIPSAAYYISFNRKTGVIVSQPVSNLSDTTQHFALQPTKFTVTARNSSQQVASTTITLSTNGFVFEDFCMGGNGLICP